MDSNFSLAYRMLGSVQDAEDVVQEAQLRWHSRVDQQQVDSEAAYLKRMVANLSVDRLRQLQRQRRAYTGPWLPDPVSTEWFDSAEQHEQLSMGFMLLLEQLPPGERIAYVLREAFDYTHPEIAETLAISPDAARQRCKRARARIRKHPRPVVPPAGECQALLEALLACIAQGDAESLITLLDHDAVALTDGGGVVSAAIIPLTDRKRIATVIMHLARKGLAEQASTGYSVAIKSVNGSIGLIVQNAHEIHSVTQIAGHQGRISRLYVMRNPNKLTHLLM